MKILIVTGIFPPDIGGPATYVPQIAEGLTRRGHKVTVLTLSDCLDQGDASYSYQVVRLSRKQVRPLRILATIITILSLGQQANLLFVNGLALESVLANFILRKPLVMKVVGDLAWERATTRAWTSDDFETFQQRRYGWRIELLKSLRTWWTRQANQVIVPSQYLARWVARWGVPEERIKVIYNALELMDGVKPMPIPIQTQLKVVTVGRLVPWKRIDGILEAIAGIPEVGLVVIGDGPERFRLKRLAESLGVSDQVYFAGACSREETLNLIAACDIFVLNSTYEGLPHVLLEAMALGLPVVATAVGGTPELVKHGETGLLVRLGDGTLEDVLRHLAKEPQTRLTLGQAATYFVQEHLNRQVMLEKTEVILEGVASRECRHPMAG